MKELKDYTKNELVLELIKRAGLHCFHCQKRIAGSLSKDYPNLRLNIFCGQACCGINNLAPMENVTQENLNKTLEL